MINLLKAEKIDVNIKTFKNSGSPENLTDKKAIDLFDLSYNKKVKNAATLKHLLKIGHLSAENANDHVTRLLDRGNNLQMDNDLNSAITNYKVANLLLKEFSAKTEEKLLLRCLMCLEHIYQAMGNVQEAKRFNRGVSNLNKKLSKKAKK